MKFGFVREFESVWEFELQKNMNKVRKFFGFYMREKNNSDLFGFLPSHESIESE